MGPTVGRSVGRSVGESVGRSVDRSAGLSFQPSSEMVSLLPTYRFSPNCRWLSVGKWLFLDVLLPRHGNVENSHFTLAIFSYSIHNLVVLSVPRTRIRHPPSRSPIVRQIREQLRKKDSWGRTILTHAVLSGRLQVFDAAFNAMREHILDSEVRAYHSPCQPASYETVAAVSAP